MSYVVLARKWRPMSFRDLVGQDHVARTLGNAITSGRVAHAFLFTGVRGVGKTTSARILAKALNCMSTVDAEGKDGGPTVEPCLQCPACQEITKGVDLDVQEIDGASYNGVDEVRKLQDSLPYRPTRDRYKIIIVDEVHMLSQAAWNAFLKTLEEPPPHVKFIFATTEVHKVPITILSRVQRFDFKLISARMIGERIRYVLKEEGIAADEAALAVLARQAAGSMRDAMSLLDQVIAFAGDRLVGDEVARVLGVASSRSLFEVAECLLSGKPPEILRFVDAIADEGFDMNHLARDLLALLRDLVVAKVAEDAPGLIDRTVEELEDVRALAALCSEQDLLRLHQGFSRSYDEVVRSSEPRSALEMLLVRLALRPPLLPIDELLHRLGHLERRLTGDQPARAAGGAEPRGPSPPRRGEPPAGDRAGFERRSAVPAPAPRQSQREPESEPDPGPSAPDPKPPAVEPPALAAATALPAAPSSPAPSPSGPAAPVAVSPSGPAAPVAVSPSAPTPAALGAVPQTAPARPGGSPPREPAAPPSAPAAVQSAPAGATAETDPLLHELTQVSDELHRRQSRIAPFFDLLTPLGWSGSCLELAAERGFVFAREVADVGFVTAAGEAAVQALSRADATVRVVLEQASASPERTVTAERKRRKKAAQDQAVRDVRMNPRIQALTQLLDAEVTNVQLPEGDA